MTQSVELRRRCELLRSLHRAGTPLLLPNAWDVASARAVVEAGFPVVATSSGAVAATLGYEDQEGAPADEMFAAAARIARAVDVPLTVDAEAGYGMEPSELVDALQTVGAAGCNLEDTDNRNGTIRPTAEHAKWLAAVRQAAVDIDYPLVVNARVDVFLGPVLSGAGPDALASLQPEGIERGRAYLEAGADCVYPIGLWEPGAVGDFVTQVGGPVNIVRMPPTPSLAELAELGVARVSWGPFLHLASMARFAEELATLRE